jgi:DNA-binding MarR family transcriptional regulator
MSTVVHTETPTVAAWVRLLRSHAALVRLFNAQLVADHGLTINDYEVLLHLSHADEARMRRTDLAERIQLTPSGVTRLLDGLERAGFVEKAECASDRRVSYAVLTTAGRERLAAASPSHLAAIDALFGERFTPDELDSLGELLGRLPGSGGPPACSPPDA